MKRLDAGSMDAGGPQIGVYVRDEKSKQFVSYRGDESWYLASMVKVPVAIAVLRAIDEGKFTLDTRTSIRPSDYVDGAGHTNKLPIGVALNVQFLMEQMIIFSDNMASDMLIEMVGIDQVNSVLASIVPNGFGRITKLSEVRRQIYGYLIDDPYKLSARDLLLLNEQRADKDRMALLSHLSGVPLEKFKMRTLEEAYTAYYATGLNSGRLDAYAELLTLTRNGKVLTQKSTDYLQSLMYRVVTGSQRIKAGLPNDVRFAHKTGTQRRRFCDAGWITNSRIGVKGGGRDPVLVVACSSGDISLSRSERALREAGASVCRSGVLWSDDRKSKSCPPPPTQRASTFPTAPHR